MLISVDATYSNTHSPGIQFQGRTRGGGFRNLSRPDQPSADYGRAGRDQPCPSAEAGWALREQPPRPTSPPTNHILATYELKLYTSQTQTRHTFHVVGGRTLAKISIPDGPGEGGPKAALGVGHGLWDHRSSVPAVVKQPWSFSSSQPIQYRPGASECGDAKGRRSHPSRPSCAVVMDVVTSSSAGSPVTVELYMTPTTPAPGLVVLTRTCTASTCHICVATSGGGPSSATEASL